MDNEIYDQILAISCDLVNSSSAGDTKSLWYNYNLIQAICHDNEGTEKDHPFQWETMADFTIDDTASLSIYAKAFDLAEALGLHEYMASIKLALAERYLNLGIPGKAYSSARIADEYAAKTNDLDLRQSVSEFLLSEKAGA